ncbi:MAG TPA: hypothetical protein VFX15_02625 [Actinomycetes bacterium]|nr:hypothetical protein [Actinomycetes bacterium]
MVTGTPTVEAQASTPRPESPARGRPIAIVLLAVVLLGGTAWWVFDRQTSIDVVVTGSSSARGIAIEADYQPVLPTTVTGATIRTEVGSDDGASLYDNSTDSDVPPESMAVRAGRSVSIYATVFPDCAVNATSDQVVVTIQTTDGARRFEAPADGLAQAARRLCSGRPEFSLSQASRDHDVVTATYVTTPVARAVTVTVRTDDYEAPSIRIEPTDGQVEWTVTTEGGCTAAERPVVAEAKWRGGSTTMRLEPPASYVCP